MHEPVLLAEALRFLSVKPDGVYLDVTVGTGGHASGILARLGPKGCLVGIDRDREVLPLARCRLGCPTEEAGHRGGPSGDGHARVDSRARVLLRPGDLADIYYVCRELGLDAVDGVLADLGLSSWQLDSAERGFSHRLPGPLDMRYDRCQEGTGADILARASAAELTDIFARYGEEPRARRLAQAIVQRRRTEPVRTTTDLADIVRSVVPGRPQGDALARTFQALRIATNGELDRLERFLAVVPSLLGVGGRLVVISFHSLEDRRVKQALGRGARAGLWRVLTTKPARPSAEEVARNPRSRSARLRAAEKLLVTGRARGEGGGP